MKTLLRLLAFAFPFQAMGAQASAAPLADSASAPWKQDFTLTDPMKVYDFPEEQVSFPVEIPVGIKPDSLTLLAFAGDDAQVVPFQLSKDAKGGTTLFFRTDLPRGATRLFRLVAGFAPKDIPAISAQPPAVQAAANPREAILGNSLLLVKVTAGHQDFAAGTPFSRVPAPILGLARKAQPEPWMAAGAFSAPDTLRVDSMDAKMVESGPLFATYQVAYNLAGGKNYTATLELRAQEPIVRIAESVNGFTPADQAFLQLNYGKGLLDPDRCLVATNGGYFPKQRTPYTGSYDEHVSTNEGFVPWPSTQGWWDYDPKKDDSQAPRLSYCLGLFAPNQIGVMHATALFRENGTDALLLALHRLPEWETHERALWTSIRATENLRFYSRSEDGQKYMAAGLAGQNRFWAVGLIPRDEVKIEVPPGAHASQDAAAGLKSGAGPDARSETRQSTGAKAPRKPEAGPEARLFNQLNDWSLNAYKDRAVDWPETLEASPFNDPDFLSKATYEKWLSKACPYGEYDAKWGGNSGFFREIVNYSWDFGLGGAVVFRSMPTRFGVYAISRAAWTQEQRDRSRQVLLFFAETSEGDILQPHHSMVSGHPNFLMDVKATLPIACATFPNHPRAKTWRDSFMSCYNEWLDQYDRKDVPELNTKGGRWTENIACYVGTCFRALEVSQKCLQAYDGTSLGQNPQVFALIRWMRDSFMSPHDGVRRIPPQGAHSAALDPGGGSWEALFQFCADLAPDDPQLAQEMRWIETNGQEGRKPDLHSALYTDYGPVFRYDFGGAHESYAHMQNINGLRYRWGHAGIVYYGAKGKVWSYNASETNGDAFDWDQVSAFNVGGKGMEATPTDQLLYDFGFAQFYRQPAKEGEAYRARGVMLLRDDYLVLSDEVQDAAVPGAFNWATLFEPPQIYQLKPGAIVQEKATRDKVRPGQDVRTGKVFSYSGKGDFLTVVAPAAVTAVATPFGATVNGEYVFASQKPQTVAQGTVVFSGNYGYARPNQLALFQGTRIGIDGLELRREGGDFGLSAEAEKNRIVGRIVGRGGGKVFVLPPKGLDSAGASVRVNGKPVPHTIEQRAVAFLVDIAQKDGLKSYEIRFGI
ncbi:MAG: hypothetical protein NTW86_00570 [Candidatus Sumerlaeota bacterium]|nr:hypothetical protein [Candidatus Sumerlaeota bacterium]